MTQETQMKRVNWLARVVLPGSVKLELRARSVSGKAVMVQSQVPFPKGVSCSLALAVDGEVAVRADCRVGESILSSTSYLVWLDVVACQEGERWLRV